MNDAVAVVGAGPAGAAAAAILAADGLCVTVFDEQPRAGGNVGRVRMDAPPTMLERLAASNTRLRLLAEARVLQLGAAGQVEYQYAGGYESEPFQAVILACGAYDMHLPLPGAPALGITSAGALQALLKSQGVVPEGDVVIAGSGPFLYVAAANLAAAGARVRAVVDRLRNRDYARLALPGLWIPGNAVEYARLRVTLLRHGVPVLRGAQPMAVEQNELVLASGRRFSFDHLGLTDLMVPQTQLPRTAGCAQLWSAAGGYFVTQADGQGRTSVPQVYVCGEGQGIRGWRHARASGERAAQACLADWGKRTSSRTRKSPNAVIEFADVLERGMRDAEPDRFDPNAVLCACENVTVAQVQKAAQLGLDDLSSIKVVTRCGMGPCQGRYCEPLVARVLEQAGHTPRAPLNQHVLSRPIEAATFAGQPRASVTNQRQGTPAGSHHAGAL